jgi:hypothetical protein
MRLAALRHSEMAKALATLQAVVSTAAESVLGCSPSDTFRVEVVHELAAEFQKIEDQRSRLEWPAMRICDLLLGPPSGWAQLADCLDEATGQLRVELAAQRRQMQSWRLCGLRLREFETWCWAAPMGHLLWQWSCSKARSMLQLLTGSVGGLVLHWLPPCHISWSLRQSWRCSGLGTGLDIG